MKKGAVDGCYVTGGKDGSEDLALTEGRGEEKGY